MPFFTRPNFEDRQLVQYSGTSINLSGDTIINTSGSLKINKGAFPGLVATSLDSDGTVVWGPISGISWSISACTSPLYVNNLVSCPLSAGTIQVDAGALTLNSELQFLISLSAGTNNDNILVIDNSGYVKSIPYVNGNNMWYVPNGYTLTIPDNYQSFIYGDLYVLGTLDLQTNAQLVVLNGNIILSGGSIIGSGTTQLVTLGIDNYVTGGTFDNSTGTLTLNRQNGSLSITGFTFNSTPFTGGTGSCITDLYVTNIHGCSPINIQPTSLDNVYMVMGGGDVGIGTLNPIQRLHVSGNTRVENDVNADVSLAVINNNNGGTSARGTIEARAIADVGGRTLSGVFTTSGYNTALAGFSDSGTGYLKNALSITVAGNVPRGDINIGTRDASKFLRFFSGSQNFNQNSLRGSLDSNGYWGFGQNMTGQTSTVHIKGYGNSNTTYALKIDDSTESPLLRVTDSGNIYSVGKIHTFSSAIFSDPTIDDFESISRGIRVIYNFTGSSIVSSQNLEISGSSILRVSSSSNGTNFTDRQFDIQNYGPNFLRGAPSAVNGDDFYQNKGVILLGDNLSGLVVSLKPNGNDGKLWFEQNANTPMLIAGGGTPSDLRLGIALNPDGTEMPTANLQVGGTGTTGTFKYRDGNQQAGYVLTSDADGNATWQASTGGSGGTTTIVQFTGNTSASCITDLYVTNLNSCSPLNIQPNPNGNVLIGANGGVNVGVGTSSPSVKLQIKGVDSTSSNTSFLVETSGATPLFSVRNDGFASVYNASQQFGEKLSVNGTVLAGTSGYLIQDGSSGYWQMYSSGNVFGIGKSSLTSPIFGIDVTNPYYIFTQSAYNFGVGISTPSAKLHVNNTTGNNTVLFEDDSNPDSTPFVIDSTGRVGIGTTTPSKKLHISGGSYTELLVEGTGADSSITVDSQQYPHFYLKTNGTTDLSINGNGTGNSIFGIPTSIQFRDNSNVEKFIMSDMNTVNSYTVFRHNLAIDTVLPPTGFVPSASLHIRGKDESLNYGLKIQNSGGTDNLVVRNDGNIGIGISTPTAKIHINNTTTGYTFLAEDSTNPDATPFTIDAGGNTFIGGLASNWDGFSKVDVAGSYVKIRQLSNALSVQDSGSNTGDWQYGAVGGKLQFVKSGAGNALLLYSYQNDDGVPFGVYVPSTNVFRVGGLTPWLTGSSVDQYTKVAIKSDNAGSGSYGLKIFNSSEQPMFTVKDNANVGIGILDPSESLEVSGRTKTTNFTMTSGATAGYVLTSDASGNATWKAPTQFTGNTSATCITDLYVTNVHGCSPINIQPTSPDGVHMVMGGGKVGIGTTSPGAKLEVIADGSGDMDFAIRVQNSSAINTLELSDSGNLLLTGTLLINGGVLDVDSNNTSGKIKPNNLISINAGVTGTETFYTGQTINTGWVIESIKIYTKTVDSSVVKASVSTLGGVWTGSTGPLPIFLGTKDYGNIVNMLIPLDQSTPVGVNPHYFDSPDTLRIDFYDQFDTPTALTTGNYILMINYWDGSTLL